MTHLVLTNEQVQAIAGTTDPIDLVDSAGRTLGRFTPVATQPTGSSRISPEELAEIKRRMATPGPGKTTAEALEYLESLAPSKPE